MKFHPKHKKLIKYYVTETISQFSGKASDNFQNLAYLYHHIGNSANILINFKDFNKLFIAAKKLSLGKVYHIAKDEKIKQVSKISRLNYSLKLSTSRNRTPSVSSNNSKKSAGSRGLLI